MLKKILIAALVVFLAYGFTKPELTSSIVPSSLIIQDTTKGDTAIHLGLDSTTLDTLVQLDSTATLIDSTSFEIEEEAVDSSNLIFGTASYYHDMFVGRLTANGQTFRQEKMTCAHRTIPLGKYVLVTNLKNNKTVKLLVNDRMGKSRHEIDLTKAAAKKLNFVVQGWTPVRIEVLD